jgi:secondary thiamine-phosphate synthase enzyme
MNWYKTTLSINSHGLGFYDITDEINTTIQEWGVVEGLAFIFIQHTSASLVINENYAGSSRKDMEHYLERIAPEGEKWYTHTMEGADDSPSHLRTMITHTNLTIPIDEGRLSLGTWQGIFLAEHRRRGQKRKILLRTLSIT